MPYAKRLRCSFLLLLSLCALGTPSIGLTEEVGRTLFSRGIVTGSLDGRLESIGPGSILHRGQVIRTGERSFAVAELSDGTRMTIRPNSVLRLDAVQVERGKESALLSVFKGGMRALTGFISKRRKNAFKVRTAAATIGIRGTDFSVRVCEVDCEANGQGDRPHAGRIAFVRGQAHRATASGKQKLRSGDRFYEGDLLHTGAGAIAVLAFRDRSRITLKSNTQFQIDKLTYSPKEPTKSEAFFRLFRGGLRAVSGLIAKAKPKQYRVATPVATIGIRGTKFDIVCVGDCGAAGAKALGQEQTNAPSAALAKVLSVVVPSANAQSANGLWVGNREGQVALIYPGGTQPIPTGSWGFMDGSKAAKVDISPAPPAGIVSDLERTPKPEDIRLPEALLGKRAEQNAKGLWLAVFDNGNIVATNNQTGEEVNLSPRTAAIITKTETRLVKEGIPRFVNDEFNINPARLTKSGTVLPKAIPAPVQKGLACTMG